MHHVKRFFSRFEVAHPTSHPRTEPPDGIEAEPPRLEDLPPRQDAEGLVDTGQMQDKPTQKEEKLALELSRKEAEINQIKQDHAVSWKNIQAHIEGLKQYYVQELHQRDGIIREMKISHANLRKAHEELGSLVVGAQESALESMLKKSDWSPKEDPQVQEEFDKLQAGLRTWTKSHSTPILADLGKIPDTEKEMIMKQLGGYCNQTDWQTLITKMPIPSNRIPAILLQSLLARDIFEWLFTNPFFAFVEMGGDRALVKPNEWMSLYMALREVHEAEAHVWRSQTLRILSAVTNPNTESRLARCIRLAVDQRATSFLASPAALLLQHGPNLEIKDQCRRNLQELYHGAAELALSLWAQRTYMKPCSQQNLPEFHLSNPQLSAHRLHHLDEDDTRLDGKPIILFVQPAVLAYGNEDAENYDCSKVWARATVIIDAGS
ncbi:conserved hypothetical protein [Histoplasma capsulatum var. duboisii H88]|uniref:Uncharacterized protein n=1 Tax=Ajellomyces capsulatus (strain H88) TaxID=544711 RepID=F0UNQ8_AJEC8|nr:conserved hypothetical protein [Histoplasma capsulatum var. duboisii H88]QSS52985.1 hypothetical protein I7I53_00093 [Histoplasma capsulatum var. duboisii H88]